MDHGGIMTVPVRATAHFLDLVPSLPFPAKPFSPLLGEEQLQRGPSYDAVFFSGAFNDAPSKTHQQLHRGRKYKRAKLLSVLSTHSGQAGERPKLGFTAES